MSCFCFQHTKADRCSDYKPSLDARAAERAERAEKDKQEQMARLMRDMNMKGESSEPGLGRGKGSATAPGEGPGKATNPFGPHFRNDREDRYVFSSCHRGVRVIEVMKGKLWELTGRYYDDEYLEDDGGYLPGEKESIARQEQEEEEAAHADILDRQDMGEFYDHP